MIDNRENQATIIMHVLMNKTHSHYGHRLIIVRLHFFNNITTRTSLVIFYALSLFLSVSRVIHILALLHQIVFCVIIDTLWTGEVVCI
jgi:hypothetical protein